MNNSLGDALKKALEEKKNDYSNFVWKGEKKKDGEKYVQNSERLIDMTPQKLKSCYKHCQKMLYNEDPKHYGRYNVLKEVNDQINKCNVELLLRYYENGYKRDENRGVVPRSTLNLSLRALKANNPEIEDWSVVPITQATSGLPAEFHNINIEDVLDGCIYYLG